ncbi:response regulator transcription factor [Rhizobium leguminosarum]|uniref:response regulator transcription factor n=1 Tax=Rhizobium leguminosarum TaxID=384 RepID=UPI0004807F0E|nr:response regulator transcription factor [Rhizobium leguminosarum]
MDNGLILIADDDPDMVEMVRECLDGAGFRTSSAPNGDVCIQLYQQLKPDLVILDIGLPRQDGYAVLAAIKRRGDTPVIMLTGQTEPVHSLQLGADDHIVKPFRPAELVERIKAVLRRGDSRRWDLPIRVGNLVVEEASYCAWVDQPTGAVNLKLTSYEFKLLAYMARASGRVLDRPTLLDACFPQSEALERTIDSHMSNLRRKLNAAGAVDLLSTVRGVGYRLGKNYG